MTREELDFIGSMNMCDEISNEAYKKIVCHCERQEPCEDAISREDALMCLTGEWTEITDEIIHRFIKRIKALPPVNPQPKWIPVSEMLPKEDGDYLVTYEKGYAEYYDLPLIGIAGFEVDCESFGYWYEHFDRQTMGSLGSEWEEIKVIAWMPLPAPFESYESEDKG